MQQMSNPSPQKRKFRKVSRRVIMSSGCICVVIIGGFWIGSSIGFIPALFGISQTNLANTAYALITTVGVVCALLALIPVIPVDDSPQPVASVPAPAPSPITFSPNIILPSPQPFPPPSPSAPSPAYRGIASQIPQTNPNKGFQQRESVVEEVYAQLTQPDISSLVLLGMGGIGKSTLAALVYRYAEKQRLAGTGPFKRDALWLRVDQTTSFLDVADNLFAVLGGKPTGFEQLSPQGQAHILTQRISTQTAPLLLVLDQFENLLNLDTGAARNAEVGEFLDALNSCACASRLLLTSRPRPKGLRADALTGLFPYRVEGLTLSEGQALLTSRGVAGTAQEMQSAVKRCQGHGLSLTLLTTLLETEKLRLSTLLTDARYTQLWDEDIATNLLNAIYTRSLTDEQREVLQALSIYREAVPLDALLPLLSAKAQASVRPCLETLQTHQLVQVVEEGKRQLHSIVATYARTHDEQHNRAATLLAHSKAAAYYLQQATHTCPPLAERHAIADVHLLTQAVRHFCLAEQWQQAHEVMVKEALCEDIRRWGGSVLLLELEQAILQGVTQLKREQQAHLYHDLGYVYHSQGNTDEALHYYQQALAIRKEVRDRPGEGATLHNLGSLSDSQGNTHEALRYYQQALAIRKEVRDRPGEGTTLHNLGALFFKKAQYDIALSFFIVAQRIFVEVQSPNSKSEQEWIDGIHEELGEERFAALWQQVEPQAEQRVEEALREV